MSVHSQPSAGPEPPEDVGVVEDVPLDRIEILNPRERKQRVFQELVASIKALGLKKPITVIRRGGLPAEGYLLVCGQGRVEAFRALGQSVIPAIVLDASEEDAFVRSLVENIARRSTRTVEQLETIRTLHQRGYEPAVIARKTALDVTWIKGVLTLLERGEERLLTAVEDNRIPITTAIAIANTDDSAVQDVLQRAYESGALRGRKLLAARRVIENRTMLGKGYGKRTGRKGSSKPISSALLVRAYNKEVERQKHLIRKADLVEHRLAFVTAALASLLQEEHFGDLLRAEGISTLPRAVDELIRGGLK
jgi:ParB family chromosome partitioning protein